MTDTTPCISKLWAKLDQLREEFLAEIQGDAREHVLRSITEDICIVQAEIADLRRPADTSDLLPFHRSINTISLLGSACLAVHFYAYLTCKI